MGATYTRQSSYTDGDTITAAHTNDEFNQLLAAFASGSGHTHDGTSAEGGPITKLLGTSITIGDATSGTDIAVTFDGETNDGVLTWMEDEDYFKFSDDIMIVDNEQLIFGTDSNVAVSYDETTTDSLKIAATEGAGLAITLMADEGDDAGDEWKLNIADGGTLTLGNDIASAGSYVTHLTITPNSTVASSTMTVAGNLTVGGVLTLGSGAELAEAELEMLDGITAGTVAASKAVVVDANKDAASFRNVTLTGELDAATLDISGNADIDGTTNLDAVDIDGAVQIDSTVTVGVDDTGYDVKFFGATSGAYMLWDEDVDDLILAGAARVIVPDGQLVLGSTAVSSTAAELNLIDGGTSRGTTAVASGDGILINDGGTMRMTNVDTVSTYFSSHNVGGSNIVTTGALDSGSITSGFGSIDTGSSTITTTGLISGGSLDIDDVLINGTTIGHTDDTDLITLADGVVTVAGEISVTTLDIGGTNVSATATEINLIDGGTARGTTSVASGDGILINDGGTMRMTNVDTVSTYFSSHNVGGSNIVTTGALNSGSITSGFGTIDTGSSAITTTGLISGGSLDIDDVVVNGTTIGHTDDTDLITLTDGVVTVAGEISVTTLDIGGTNITATATEINLIDGGTARGTTSVASGDGILINDGGTMRMTNVDTVSTYFSSHNVGGGNIVTTGALNSGSITSGFGSIDIGSSALSTTGSVTLGATSFGDANITNVGSISLDSIASDAGTGTAITMSAGLVGNTHTNTSVSGTVAPDMSQYTNFVWTLTGNLVLDDPGDEVAGQGGIFVFIQDGTGSRTLSHAANQYFSAGGSAITISTAASAIDVVPYFVQADGKIHLGAVQKAFADA